MNLNLALIDRTTYRIAAAIICITCLFYSTTMRKRNIIRNRLFMMLVVFTLIDCFTEPISYIFIYSPLPDSIKWDHGFSFRPNRIDNKSFPADWVTSGIAAKCAENCTHCGKCEEIMQKALKYDVDHEVRAASLSLANNFYLLAPKRKVSDQIKLAPDFKP